MLKQAVVLGHAKQIVRVFFLESLLRTTAAAIFVSPEAHAPLVSSSVGSDEIDIAA